MTDARNEKLSLLRAQLDRRILVLDGAMGTMIQRRRLVEADYRGDRFRDHGHDLTGDNDLLVLTRPDVIREIHHEYLAAGADIIETNTFNGTSIAQADYHLEHIVPELNRTAARIAREAADDWTRKTPDRPRFVAGAIGPTNRTLSISPDVNDPAFRADHLRRGAWRLLRAGPRPDRGRRRPAADRDDLRHPERKAAIVAVRRRVRRLGVRAAADAISVTITDRSGRTLSGQTVDAFWTSIATRSPLSSASTARSAHRDAPLPGRARGDRRPSP
jgi:5-methyltetrahydrofolate--homocysteine methyltransferase